MKTAKVLKAIAAFAGGLVMIGATIGATHALDLGNYPQPFIVDGQWQNGKIVLGATAKVDDTMGAVDVIAGLQAAAVTLEPVTTTGETEVTVEGGVSLNSESDKVYFGDAINAVRTTLSGDDLTMLGDKTFTDDSGTNYDYTLSVEVGSNATFVFDDANNELDDSTFNIGLPTTAAGSSFIYELKATFTDAINLTDTDVQGQEIELFGSTYTISSDSTATKLVLFGGALEDNFDVGEEKTITFEGEDYTIKVLGIEQPQSGSNRATVSVTKDGTTVTKTITEGTTKKINGLDIYAKELVVWSAPQYSGTATLRFGARKLVFENGKRVKYGDNEDSIKGTYVTMNSPGGALNYLYVSVSAEDSDVAYLTEGQEFTDPVFGTLKFSFPGTNQPEGSDSREDIEFKNSGTNTLAVEFTDSKGDDGTVEFATYSSGWSLADDDSYSIHVIEGETATEKQYVIVNAGTNPEDYTASRIFRIDDISFDGDTSSDTTVDLYDLFSGETITVSGFTGTSNSQQKTKVIDGQEFDVNVTTNSVWIKRHSSSDYVVFPVLKTSKGAEVAFLTDLNMSDYNATTLILPGDSDVDGHTLTLSNNNSATITDDMGITYYFANETGEATGESGHGYYLYAINISGQYFDLSTPLALVIEEDDDSSTRRAIVVQADLSSDSYAEVGNVSLYTENGYAAFSGEQTSDDDVTKDVSYYGSVITFDSSNTKYDTATISYPDTQIYAQLWFAPTTATTTTTTTENYREVVNPLPTGLTVKDVDAPALGSVPLLVVGGPCVNSVAAELMENPANCAEGFEDGKAIIKLFPDQNALLVAGYSGGDTQAACQVLKDYSDYTDEFTGKTEVQVITSTKQVTEVTTTTPTEETNTTTNTTEE